MHIKLLEREQYAKVYEEHMKADFPADELKPLAAMLNMHDRGIYEGYGLYDGGNRVGYGFLVVGAGSCALLDYLAVCPGLRNGGYGSAFLGLLSAQLKRDGKAPGGMILESERADAGRDREEQALRRRRIGFYERNGFSQMPFRCVLFGVAFTILHRPADGASERPAEEIFEELDRIYREMGIRDRVLLERESAPL